MKEQEELVDMAIANNAKINFTDNSKTPLEKQVGGCHYKNMVIQPVEFCMRNNLNFCVSSAIKYLCRYKYKDGLTDLMKARQVIDILMAIEYPCTDVDFEKVE